ncbi:MAG TPA: response regulator transcription factor, partial [Campylobacterales bacterium]|nr:response regulator transcription factor [Campylobacterales bacterium]
MQNNFSNLTILYVEDDDVIRENAVEYLNNYCKEVFQARDGKEALSVYEIKHPDVIITDIEMPKLNGLEMAKEIRKKDKKTPIVMATAFTDENYLLQAVELQLIKYIVKPINSKKLKVALSLVLEHLHLNSVLYINKDTCYDKLNKTLMVDNTFIKLTNKEVQLLDLLAKYHHRVVTYEEIENVIWYDDAMSKDALRALVRSLRI